MKVKKGDNVKIISGNDRGKQGKVIYAFPRQGRIVVEGVNIRKKHVRPRRQDQKGELVALPAPLSSARVMIICTKCAKPTRVKSDIKDGKKTRACRACGAAT